MDDKGLIEIAINELSEGILSLKSFASDHDAMMYILLETKKNLEKVDKCK